MVALADTNILVYRFDPRFPERQRVATEILRRGIEDDSIRIAHQGVVEFVAVVTRPLREAGPLLSPQEARTEAEALFHQFEILYPNEEIVRLALRGWATYPLSWFDAHMWAHAEYYGLEQILSEDFAHERLYGSVLAINPFLSV